MRNIILAIVVAVAVVVLATILYLKLFFWKEGISF